MRRALVVGINHYPTAPLHGCVTDAKRIAALLATNDGGSPNFSTRVFTEPNEIGTKADLRQYVEELFGQEAEVAIFYFSGHGCLTSTGGCFVTPDATRYDEGLPMETVLKLANAAKIKQRVIVMDCCHSGDFGSVSALAEGTSALAEGVTIVTASRRNQAAIEVGGEGLFTSLICDGLEGGASDVRGNVTAAGLYAYVDEALDAWEQRPIFKTHVSQSVLLRTCKPVIDLGLLRLIPSYFITPEYEFPLDPSYEPDANPQHPEHEEIFGNLQKFRGARLVEPVGTVHMYYAAIQSLSCRLTPLGRQYWRLVNKGRL